MRLFLLFMASAVLAWGQANEPLRLEKTVELPDVKGRIDHMSVDVKGQRLFVSALGNNTLEVIDLKSGKRIKTVTGLAEPQGALYVPDTDRLYVANSKDGSVRVFDGTSYAPVKTIEYGEDADNLRYDQARQLIYVGFGSGALGQIDNQGNKAGEIKLGSHPESFQLEKNSARVYVNLPKSHKVAVVDREKRTIIGGWGTGMDFANYPMALDETEHRLFVITRYPARLLVFDTNTGKTVQTRPAIGDCDDVFYDAGRKQIYAIGGEGGISVFREIDADHYEEIARIKTVPRARTGFFSPDLDRLFVAVRQNGTQPAAVQIFQPKR